MMRFVKRSKTKSEGKGQSQTLSSLVSSHQVPCFVSKSGSVVLKNNSGYYLIFLSTHIIVPFMETLSRELATGSRPRALGYKVITVCKATSELSCPNAIMNE